MSTNRSSTSSPSPGLPPPPVPAVRRRNPMLKDLKDETSQENRGNTPPPVPPRRTSLNQKDMANSESSSQSVEMSDSTITKGTLNKANSMFGTDSGSIYHENPNALGSRISLPVEHGGCFPDLAGLDFSATFADPPAAAQSENTSSMADVASGASGTAKSVYPDISHVFREITGPSYGLYPNVNMPSLPSPAVSGTQVPSSIHTQVSPSGWNPGAYNFSQMPYPVLPFGSSLAVSGMPHTQPQENIFPAPVPNYGNALFVQNSRMNSAAYDHQGSASYDVGSSNNMNKCPPTAPMQRSTTPNPSYMPNIVLPRPASLGNISEVSRGSSQSPTDNQAHPMVVAGFDENTGSQFQVQNSEGEDLIHLGQTLPEHEYLSLDFFDPLYARARKESVVSFEESVRATNAKPTNFSFGEAFPNLYHDQYAGAVQTSPRSAAYDHNAEHIWQPAANAAQTTNRPAIGFEAFDFDSFGHEKFGSSESEFLQGPPSFGSPGAPIQSAAYDAVEKKPVEKPIRPPSRKVPVGKRYEKLRKRTFIDPESESFCEMVAHLKKQYLSTDEKTNQGYLLNQLRETHMGSLQVKLVVHTQFSQDPICFTCDTSALVEHAISHVLYSISNADPQPSTDLFILKVFDRTEYLCNDLPLAKFDYVHTCLKLNKDIDLELVSAEEVTRPFIRTKDDDLQILYFPKEYINADGTAVSQDTLAVYIDTFYLEVDVLLEHFTQGATGSFHIQGLQQSVKALCIGLAKIETNDITKALERLTKTVQQLGNPSAESQKLYGSSRSRDKDTQDAINIAVRCNLIEDLEEAVDELLNAVKRLVRMYCRTFLTDFFLGSSVEIPHDHLEVVKVKDNFIACLASAHRIPSGWNNRFEEYKIVCSLFYGAKRLVPDLSTSLKPLTKTGLCERIVWDEWLQFEHVYLCTLPRETRLCIMLCGVRSAIGEKSSNKGDSSSQSKKVTYPLGAAAMQLFSEKGYLLQGPQLIPLSMGVAADPIMPSCKTLMPDSVLLQVTLPDFERTIYFPEPLNAAQSPTKSYDDLAPQIKSLVMNVMEKESCSTFTSDELEVIWSHRHYMTEKPSLLPRILQSAHSWDWASLAEIYSLLRHWKPLHPMQAFELLLPQFPDVRVREFAANSLNKIPTDDLVDFLPQMIQGLKFESYHNSPLAKLLLEQSCKSPRFAHQFFWLLKVAAAQEATFKRRYELMFVALASVAGDALYQEFRKQEELVKLMTSVAEKVKKARDKDATLRRELIPLHEMVERKGRILLPYNPSVEVVGLDMKSCSYFTSAAFPLKLVFQNSNPKAGAHYVIYKVGDDLRQDMLTLQMIRIMDSLWLQQGLDLRMITFACLPTGPKKGVIELITESDTLRKIQVSGGVTGSFKDRPIKEWLQKHNPTELEYKKAVENFTYSCAGYCVATYVLGVGDRHNDNIMLKQSGHMFHIDFSKFLGDAQMFGNIKRDRVPFVLTSDMAYVINDGARQGHQFQHFIDICCQAFNILRKHTDLFTSLFILMARSGIPGVTEQSVKFIQGMLLPGLTDGEATATFTRLIEESMKSVFTQFNFFLHNLAQLKFSSHSDGALLTFVPKVYSHVTDGKIASVELMGFQKRYTPDKHYIFIVKIERENQKVPMYIFRHFEEFVEFRDKMSTLFPLVTWPNFSTRVVIGRRNVRPVAESRKMEINNFLQYLWSKAEEISQCDLVYTFFHPLLRDEQEAEKSNLAQTKLREPLVQRTTNTGNGGIQGDIKLSVQYKRDALHVMVMHVRGLPEGSELPSPYVKTYLLPDPDKQTKLKTKVVKNTSHPTFNEVLQYQLPQLEICHRILQVTVWDRDRLMENSFLGAVYIKLRELDLSKDNTQWHPLGRLQM